MRIFTEKELREYDGREGVTYIAYLGKVYDVSTSYHWRHGIHHATHCAGCDLTEASKRAPHNADPLKKFPQIGKLLKKGESGS